jgi:hypothetical protein
MSFEEVHAKAAAGEGYDQPTFKTQRGISLNAA